ncbi:MAG: diaminopimelate epimerase [Anaerotignum propionicum]|jgi:diaminopimelate epimerase|uniref:diaminopimelate epimerase n=1 Tax=Anaerotignum propionicum TaxID=28446 RepID=UPI002B20D280|nr:diaminopimelate epimerase [Anaerotignum propionicum]MEA5057015.1 diaminopimelate epimerase [Anaerotignum propionicum]
MRFTKMEGCGNDYIYINCFEEVVEQPEKLAIAMSERHFGVGADGLVLIMPSEKADFRMRMFNLDGSEGEMCGNAVRCIGKYTYERGLTNKEEISLETAGGIKYLKCNIEKGIVKTVRVDMGEPILEAEKIPVKHETSPVIRKSIVINNNNEFQFTCVSMGNPHGVAFVEETENFPVQEYGKQVENNPAFPKKTNVEFVQLINRNHIKMRVWERGSGETLACGTGACASVVASILNGFCDREVKVSLLGGELTIHWNEENNHVYMTGPAAFSFDGVWLKDV